MRGAAIRDGSYHLSTTQVHQRVLGILSVRMINFWCINTSKANVDFVDHNGVAINHPAMPTDDLMPDRFLDLPKWLSQRWFDPLGRNGGRRIAGERQLMPIGRTLGPEQFQQCS